MPESTASDRMRVPRRRMNRPLTIEPVANVLLVTEASGDRFPRPPTGAERIGVFPHPDTGWPTMVTGNNIVHLTDDASQEAHAWAQGYAYRVDFFATNAFFRKYRQPLAGGAFSPPYDIGIVLPRRGFKTAGQQNAENTSNQDAHGTR
jgi:hypothetical protein